MSRRQSLLWVTALVLAAAGAPVHAQDSLEALIKSQTISRTQRATMEAEVSVRVKRFVDAGSNAERRAEARDRLIRTAQTKGASKAGLDAYAEICSNELKPVMGNSAYDISQDAMLILTTIDNPFTVDAISTGLESQHAAIRLMAARGIQALHAKMGDRPSECETALSALAKAGAAERNELVLRVTYRAINFPADAPGFKYADSCAAALNSVFHARLQQLAGGSRNEHRDAEGLTAAAACYAGASSDQKIQLMRHLADFLQSAINRYFDPDTGDESHSALADIVDRIETVIHGMMKQSNVTPPSVRLAARLRGKVSDRKKQEADVRAALTDLQAILAKDPWKISS